MAGFLSRLFGGGSGEGGGTVGEPESYKGYTITAAPRPDGGQWLTAGTIVKEVGGETRRHDFIRADRHADREGAAAFSLRKARQIIDEQGDRVFGKG